MRFSTNSGYVRGFLATALFVSVFFVHSQNVIVLGLAQDGGFPHIGCQKACLQAHQNPDLARYITSLALADAESGKWWLFEASPDMDRQIQYFHDLTNHQYNYLPEGIFITHAHMGHYTGLMFLGREALGANGVKVYALPRLIDFLSTNGPWSQLISLDNIDPVKMKADSSLTISENIQVTAFTVPHRNEYSETAGFRIETNKKDYLFIPDIDKWSKWDRSIVEEIKKVDYAFLDATFFQDGELPNRAMSEVPHPFVKETMALFENESELVKKKVQFIHLNHTNPLLFSEKARIEVLKNGFGIAEQGKVYN
ncbi:MAG: MBL fold metallo-hydrolase [Ekhidna sp.]|uniref:MBL fold metallo-hydrolase n=1 Tax=Ekhidna sp. TaxID=2608089 RepID=UPI0032ED9829